MNKLSKFSFLILIYCLIFTACSKKDDFTDDSIPHEYYVKGTINNADFFIANDVSQRILFGYDFKKRTVQSNCFFRANSGLGTHYGNTASSDKSGFSLYQPYFEIRLLNLNTSVKGCVADEDDFKFMLRSRTYEFYNSDNYNALDLVDIVYRDEKGVYWKLAEQQPTNALFEITNIKEADVIPNYVEIIGIKTKGKLIANITNGSTIKTVNLNFIWRFSKVL